MVFTAFILVLFLVAVAALVAVLRRRLPQRMLPVCCAVLFGELMLLVQVAQQHRIWQTAVAGTGALLAFVALAIGVLTQESQLPLRWWRHFEADLRRFHEQGGQRGPSSHPGQPGPLGRGEASA